MKLIVQGRPLTISNIDKEADLVEVLALKIIVNTKACYGCRTCELACSYHHKKVFSPELSSIKVLTNNRTGKITWSVDSTCDSCEGEERPLCMEYCFYQALKEVK